MKFIVIAAILVATACAFDEATFTEQPDDELLQSVQSSVMAMQKKGATDSDCMDLAKTSCKQVERERSTNQGMLNKLANGAKCPGLGQGAVNKAWNLYVSSKNTWNASKKSLNVARNARVTFSNQKFNTMQKGNCGFVFSSRSYVSAKNKLSAAKRHEAIWKGKTSGAHKAWKVAVAAAKKLRKTCHCDAQVSARNIWNAVGNAKLLKKQNRAHTKCKMMACVLKGTNARNRKCQGSLPVLRKKVLTTATRRENCKGHKVIRKKWHTLLTLTAGDKTKTNKWSGWYTKGNNGYSKIKVDRIALRCGNKVLDYQMNKGYKGRTLLSIVKGCGLHSGAKNNGRGKWRTGHCTNVALLTRGAGVSGATNLRIGVGDNSNDGPDWALFMAVRGNGKGDFAGSKIWDFGGETYMNDAHPKDHSTKCSITGYGQ
jgi:hypothetical protein